MKFFPIFMNIQHQPCLVVGGGQIAARKVFLLNRAGASVTVVSPELCHELQETLEKGEITYLAENFSPEQITNQRIVVFGFIIVPPIFQKPAGPWRRRGVPLNARRI